MFIWVKYIFIYLALYISNFCVTFVLSWQSILHTPGDLTPQAQIGEHEGESILKKHVTGIVSMLSNLIQPIVKALAQMAFQIF